jgi:argininosuccinate lyase
LTKKGTKTSKQREPSGIRKGRFKSGMAPEFASFNASISFDKRLYREDIEGTIAHVKMLAAQGIITSEEGGILEDGLRAVLSDIEQGRVEFREDLEDIHINIEEALRAKVGDVAGKAHTARSRNDQVALDLRMFIRDQCRGVMDGIMALAEELIRKSEDSIDAIMPGYTHLQRAQPVRLAHHLMAYFQMLRRDWERFRDAAVRLDEMPLGSAALAGTTFPIDRSMVARSLGFSRITSNSVDSVSDRDFAAEFLFNSSMVMTHLSRLAEELILWSSAEFGFCSLPDAFCSGSSIMPQKKNPDACELIRGKTGRVYGALVALLTVLKALPLTYNKDLQEDKEPVFDATDTVRGSLAIMKGLIAGIKFDRGRMLEAASDPQMAATDLADRLAQQGVPFREAHARIGALVRSDATSGKEISGSVPGPEEMVEARKHGGGTARARVMDQILEAKAFLKRNAETIAPGTRYTG